ncbi:nucleotidyltransferase family protein [Aurantiacibacter hainanensis]|uniref:nucleotidyltransferase family protein n=1 Tax=Aurantiacibacter hainanensis TaxID=3076114 RepID=UPI0030C67E6A
MSAAPSIDGFLASHLRGEAPPWPPAWTDREFEEQFARRVFFHGIAGLLVDQAGALAGWPSSVTTPIRAEALAQAMWELKHLQVLRELLDALQSAGIPSVVTKGSAMAYALYPQPNLRRRGDTDLLVRDTDLAGARDVFTQLGFTRLHNTHGPFGDIHFQEVWQHRALDGTSHDIDLHWRVTNSNALDRVLPVEECFERSIALPRLHPVARASDPVTRLVNGCLSRASHAARGYVSVDCNHYDGDRLVWAMDYHLLAREYGEADWAELVRLTCEREVAAICLDGLRFARKTLGTSIPECVERELAAASPDSWVLSFIDEPSDLRRLATELRAIGSTKRRLQMVLAHALPSAAFMRSKYPQQERWPLAALYGRRLLAKMVRLGRRGQ